MHANGLLFRLTRIFALSSVLVVAGCGFELRGTSNEAFGLERLNYATRNQDNLVADELRLRLQNQGVVLSTAAPYRLETSVERWTRRELSRSTRNTAKQRELTGSIEYALLDSDGAVVLGPETLSVQRFMVMDASNHVAAGEQEQLLKNEIRAELASQLVMRLSRVTESSLQPLRQQAESKRP